MFKFLVVALSIVLTYPNISSAEIYKDFKPYISLAQIKTNYPNGKISEVKAAWVTSDKGFYSLTGAGIQGTIYLAFNNTKPLWQNQVDIKQAEIANLNQEVDNAKLLETNSLLEIYKKYLDRPIDEQLELLWVRWVPVEVIPIARLENKYGKAEKCGFSDEDFRPYCSWITKGVSVNLTDDQKSVYYVEYAFTENEENAALGIEPVAVKEEKTAKKPGSVKRKSK